MERPTVEEELYDFIVNRPEHAEADTGHPHVLAHSDGSEHELKGVPDRWHLYRVVA